MGSCYQSLDLQVRIMYRYYIRKDGKIGRKLEMKDNYRSHVMELRDIIKANGKNTQRLIEQSKKFEKVIEYYDHEYPEHYVDMELVNKMDNIKNDVKNIIGEYVNQHTKLFEAYDRLIDDLLEKKYGRYDNVN